MLLSKQLQSRLFYFTLCILLLWNGITFAGQSQSDFIYDPADQNIKTHTFDNPMLYDADVLSTDEGLWFTWLEFTPGEGDRIWIALRNNDNWIHQKQVTPYPAQLKNPTLTLDSNQQLWLSYEKELEGHWDIFLRQYDPGKQVFLNEKRISESNNPDINHQIEADNQGGLWLVWQSGHKGQYDIVARYNHPDSPHFIQRLSTTNADDWHPDLAITQNNHVHVVWDVYDGKSYNVRYRRWNNGTWSDIADLAATDAFEGRAQIVAGNDNIAWVAYEEGRKNWGHPYFTYQGHTDQRGYYKMDQKKGPLHSYRYLNILGIAPHDNGEWHQYTLKESFPMPSVEQAIRRENTSYDKSKLGAFYERAQLCKDQSGRIWMAYRHYYAPWMGMLGIMYRSHIEDGFKIYARNLSNKGWSKLYAFDHIQGDGMQRLQITPHGNGIASVWTMGRTDRRQNQDKRPRGLAWAINETQNELKAPGYEMLSSPSPLSTHPIQQPKDHSVETAELNGKTYQLFYGDLHRHTDISLCRVPMDGTIDDAYRYAINPAGLDFLGITDHSRDLALGNHLSQLWWRNRKEVNRHHLLSNFFPFYAFERSHGNTADHNVISLNGEILRPHTYPVPEFWTEFGSDIITIPHQPIRRDTWNYQDDVRRPLMEIFQGCRTQSIENDAHQGLAKGFHIGFIASSDHMSTGASFACVWAEEQNRQSIFNAMQRRRTYGATAKIKLIVRTNNHWMGEIIKAMQMPTLHIEAKGTTPITKVQFVVDGKVHKTIEPNQTTFTHQENLGLEGNHYVYIRLEQEDGHQAWSSPIWCQIESKE